MATTTETPAKRGRPRKIVNLSTAKVADGALPSNTAIYDLCGISTSHYRAKSIAEYSKELGTLNLIELQDEAYKAGVVPSRDRFILIDRLERQFIKRALQRSRMNQIKAAEMLGIHRNTLFAKMGQFGMREEL